VRAGYLNGERALYFVLWRLGVGLQPATGAAIFSGTVVERRIGISKQNGATLQSNRII
jgi:hypothetical protein